MIDPRVLNVIVVACIWGITLTAGFLLGVVKTRAIYQDPSEEV